MARVNELEGRPPHLSSRACTRRDNVVPRRYAGDRVFKAEKRCCMVLGFTKSPRSAKSVWANGRDGERALAAAPYVFFFLFTL